MSRLDFRLLARLLQRRHAIVVALSALVGLCVLSSEGSVAVDRLLRDARDAVRAHPASGEVHIVEIDSRSLQSISQWPWPRRNHARLVDRLHEARTRSVAFDVDFSAHSNPADDAAFAAALERAGGGIILASLRQHAGAGSAEIIENTPIERLRDNAFTASVNIIADRDGQVRTMLTGLAIDGAPRPALAALLAESRAEIGRVFRIDTSIRPETIPRHSFVDIVEGRVPAAELAGKRILVGATAIEMGDRYAVPRHGVIPGVVIQALAAETLLAGPVPRDLAGGWALALTMALVAVTIRPGRRAIRIAGFAGGAIVILALPLAAEQWFAASFAIAPALLALASAGLLALGFHGAGQYHRRALTDRATGLPNRAALEAEAEGAPVVVARIERFDAIAAGLGPAATATLLLRVADRLGFEGGIVHRLDEASLGWIEPAGIESGLPDRLEALAALMRAPVDCGRLVDVTLSFGIADPVAEGMRQQIANAALAAARAAREGARWARFAEGESEETDWHLSLLGELDAAMAAGHVWNAYQPKLDLHAGRIVAVEALVRWDHAERGRIAPDAFIPLVEDHGRIGALTRYVFTGALRDAALWHRAGHPLGVAVNVSAALLLDDAFVAELADLVAGAQIPPGAITIEVTETAAMNQPEQAIAALERWRALGVNISIDDYGTGQSSLGYLQKLPASELKIDMSFVRTLVEDQRNAIMVRSTIAMAHELGLKVVAEGIEDAECLALLKTMGCDNAQGWHIGKPMPAPELLAFVSGEQAAAA